MWCCSQLPTLFTFVTAHFLPLIGSMSTMSTTTNVYYIYLYIISVILASFGIILSHFIFYFLVFFQAFLAQFLAFCTVSSIISIFLNSSLPCCIISLHVIFHFMVILRHFWPISKHFPSFLVKYLSVHGYFSFYLVSYQCSTRFRYSLSTISHL